MSNYQRLSILGQGPRATVHAVLNQADGEIVALKTFHAGSTHLARREFEIASSFQHSHLLCPKALTDEGIVFPYCNGRSVECLSGFLPEVVAWKLLSQVASALGYLAGMDFCHGGVCPSNILWDGKDFLLAGYGSGHYVGETSETEGPDDFRYSAPEGFLDGKSDVWSLGASVFALVLGAPVFNGMGGRAQQPASPVPYLRESMPELSDLLCQCLAFNPSERPFATVLSACADASLKRCLEKKPMRPLKPIQEREMSKTGLDYWPDTMMDL